MRRGFYFTILAAVLASCGPKSPVLQTDALKRVDLNTDVRKKLAITVTNRNLALVRETRLASMGKGHQVLHLRGISDEIISESVRVSSAGSNFKLDFDEQNYDADLITPSQILEHQIDRPIRIYLVNPGTGKEELVEGILRSGEKGVLFETKGGIHVLPPQVRFEIDELPQELSSQPVLSWLVNSSREGQCDIDTTYLTGGFSWTADYVVDIDQKTETADIQAWATVTNDTALALEDTSLQLVAGDLNLVRQPDSPVETILEESDRAMPLMAPLPAEETLFEYHLYTFPNPIDLAARQQKQLTLAQGTDVPFATRHSMRVLLTNNLQEHLPTTLKLEIEHKSQGALPVSLPAGTVAIWTTDEGSNQRITVGETRIDHTPVDEPFALELSGDPAIRGRWIPERSSNDEFGRRLLEGDLKIVNRTSKKIMTEIEFDAIGNKAVVLTADQEPIEGVSPWILNIGLEPNEEKTIAIRTLPN
jgi:hypothetical protein